MATSKVCYILFEDKVSPLDKVFPMRPDEDRIEAIKEVIKSEVHGKIKFVIERVKKFGDKKKNGIIIYIKNKDAFKILRARFKGSESGETFYEE